MPSFKTSYVAVAIALACFSRLLRGKCRGQKQERGGRGWLYAPEVSEEHASGKDHGDGVGLVGAHDILTNVSASGLEQGVFLKKKKRENPELIA